MIETINMLEFKQQMSDLSHLFDATTTRRAIEKMTQNGTKVYSESVIKKVRAGLVYNPIILDVLIEIAQENKRTYLLQMEKIEALKT